MPLSAGLRCEELLATGTQARTATAPELTPAVSGLQHCVGTAVIHTEVSQVSWLPGRCCVPTEKCSFEFHTTALETSFVVNPRLREFGNLLGKVEVLQTRNPRAQNTKASTTPWDARDIKVKIV